MQIGPCKLSAPVVLAPMAGLTDAPFRRICLECGAGLVVGEMTSSEGRLRNTNVSQQRFTPDPADPLPVVQIVGADPAMMADAAAWAQKCGARIVDVNFGCPARAMCGKACGSAVMRDPALAREILQAVAQAVTIPVTVKMRSGWDAEHATALEIALAAQEAGFAAVTIHGRTRAQKFTGQAEYDTAKLLVDHLRIPVIVNGDIDTPTKAWTVLKATGAAGVMVGRAACGNPWLLGRVAAVCAGQDDPGEPDAAEVCRLASRHWQLHEAYWGCTVKAVRSFRRHLLAYSARLPQANEWRTRLLASDQPEDFEKVFSDCFGRGGHHAK